MRNEVDVIIAGGGVIGASIAWGLARQDLRVLLLDATQVGAQASSAAAGMLSPGGEFEDPATLEFANRSLAMYPDFIRQIEADGGLAVEFRRTGTVDLGGTVRPGSRPLSRDELRALVPLAHADAASAVLFPDDAIVDPAALMRALRAACIARRVQVQEGVRVKEIQGDANALKIGDACCRAAVIAAGAWSSQIRVMLDGRPYALPLSLPVKGHLLGYRLPAGSLAATVRHEHTYVLQRGDGFTIAGSSTEDKGFNREIDPEVVSDIAARAAALVPALASLEPESVWTGLRPGSESEAPHVGRVGSSRLFLAYGHYRNGILLAPATCERMCREITAALE